MAELSAEAKALFQQPIPGWVTTRRKDGSLHSTVVWVDADDQGVYFNTAVGRAKERHLRNDPTISVSVLDPANPYHLVSVSGTATLDTTDADATIDRLAKKYIDADVYPGHTPDEQRINVRVRADKVIYNG
ncbi:PPOX class F420-dependent oxidoreductase [Actinocorallia longicatena]|uniref:Pyridoxamine 5'-phosphate oxidase N-terminal domain-containing protein n=1 Tax=Actinocorallia longicatena TaxID=111803 RepID=A0ABP6QHM4_9ACTN